MSQGRVSVATAQLCWGYGLLHGMEPSEDAVYEVALTAFRFLVDETWF